MEEPLGAAAAGTEVPGTILIVEDEVLIRLMIADELMRAGFPVIQCASGDEAWRVLQSSVHIDLIVTDIRMPGSIDGIELADRVRVNRPRIKVVLATGDTPGRRIGDAFLGKPYSPHDLVECVQKLLMRRNVPS